MDTLNIRKQKLLMKAVQFMLDINDGLTREESYTYEILLDDLRTDSKIFIIESAYKGICYRNLISFKESGKITLSQVTMELKGGIYSINDCTKDTICGQAAELALDTFNANNEMDCRHFKLSGEMTDDLKFIIVED